MKQRARRIGIKKNITQAILYLCQGIYPQMEFVTSCTNLAYTFMLAAAFFSINHQVVCSRCSTKHQNLAARLRQKQYPFSATPDQLTHPTQHSHPPHHPEISLEMLEYESHISSNQIRRIPRGCSLPALCRGSRFAPTMARILEGRQRRPLCRATNIFPGYRIEWLVTATI